MSSGPVYLASDVHLGAVPQQRGHEFTRWLEHAAERASSIVINGDLFDFWFEYRSTIPRGHTRILGTLARIVDGGVPVRLVGGNHDWWGGSFLEEEIGVTFQREPEVVDLGGRRTLLAHGDGIGRGDLGYRVLKGVLRGRLARWAFRWLHPDVGAAVARRVSATETRGEATADDRRRAAELEAWARATMVENPALDAVILGHTHQPARIEVEPGRWYLNSGDWVHHRTFLVLEEASAPRLEEWPG